MMIMITMMTVTIIVMMAVIMITMKMVTVEAIMRMMMSLQTCFRSVLTQNDTPVTKMSLMNQRKFELIQHSSLEKKSDKQTNERRNKTTKKRLALRQRKS